MIVDSVDRNLTYTPGYTPTVRASVALQAYTDVTGDPGQISRGKSGGARGK